MPPRASLIGLLISLRLVGFKLSNPMSRQRQPLRTMRSSISGSCATLMPAWPTHRTRIGIRSRRNCLSLSGSQARLSSTKKMSWCGLHAGRGGSDLRDRLIGRAGRYRYGEMRSGQRRTRNSTGNRARIRSVARADNACREDASVIAPACIGWSVTAVVELFETSPPEVVDQLRPGAFRASR